MLRWRIISALVILAVLLTLLAVDYQVGPTGAWLTPLLLVLALAATQELLDLLGERGWRPVAWTAYAGVGLVLLAACLPSTLQSARSAAPAASALPVADVAPFGWPLAALVIALALVFVGELARYQRPGEVLTSTAMSVFTVTYIGALMSFLAALRFLGGNQWGMAAVVMTVMVVKLSDVGQYAFGRLLGRNKLAPRVSPGKTIEGAVGGVVTACAAAWLGFELLVPRIVPGAKPGMISWSQCLLFGLAVALAGMLGDLAVSMVKRDVGRKDSSRWLPGLGGVLDVLDSLLMAAPAAYFWWLLRPLLP